MVGSWGLDALAQNRDQ